MLKHKNIIYYFLILFSIFAISIIPSLLPVQSLEQKQETQAQNNELSARATAVSIFNNNIVIAGVSLIPYLGWGFTIFVAWTTGVVVASYQNAWYWMFTNPFAWIEFGIISFGIVKSFKILRILKQRSANDFWYTLARTVSYSFIFMTLTLLASAIVEYYLISRIWTI